MSKYDKNKFAELLNQAKGNRSINKYALDCGVSAAHISRLLRGLLDTPPTPDILRKLANSVQNNVTYENLMEAAGHIHKVVVTFDTLRAVKKDPEIKSFREKLIDLMIEEKIIDKKEDIDQRTLNVIEATIKAATIKNNKQK